MSSCFPLRFKLDTADPPWTPLRDGWRLVVPLSADSAHRAGPDRLHAGHRPGGGPAGLHEKVALALLISPPRRPQECLRQRCPRRLKKLSLSNTQVTDAGLPPLRGLQELQELCLDRTAVTSRGVADLITCLPHLQVRLHVRRELVLIQGRLSPKKHSIIQPVRRRSLFCRCWGWPAPMWGTRW